MNSSSSRDDTLVWRTCLVYLTIFAWSGFNQPFLPLWLAERRLSEPEIAVVIGLPMFMRILVTPVVGRLADRIDDRRRLIRMLAISALALGLGLWASTSFWAILLFYVLMMIPLQNISPVFDASALDLVRRGVVREFGRLRLWGSAGYAAASVAGGGILWLAGPGGVFVAFLVGVLAVLLASYALPAAPKAVPRPTGVETRLLGRPGFVAMTLAASLVLGSQATWNGFGSIHLRQLGVPDGLIGLFWAAATSAEIAMFWAGPLLARWFSPPAVLVLAASGALVRWSIMAADPGPLLTLLLQLLHSATFSCSHLGVMGFYAAAVSQERGGAAQATFVTTGSVVLGIATLAAGPLYRQFGGGAYLFSALLPVLALVVLWAFRHTITGELSQVKSS